jgi:hypothetical protein
MPDEYSANGVYGANGYGSLAFGMILGPWNQILMSSLFTSQTSRIGREAFPVELSSVVLHVTVLLVTSSTKGMVCSFYYSTLCRTHMTGQLSSNVSLTETSKFIWSIMLLQGENSLSSGNGMNTHFVTWAIVQCEILQV